jgi:hypothetical protein
MNESCIFNSNKLCNDCGECDLCDLDPLKKCDSCGKCISMNNSDMKVVNIDEIQEEEVEITESENIYSEEISKEISDKIFLEAEGEDFGENLEEWELIDDIDGIDELLSDDANFKDRAIELFPGLIVIKD